MVQPPKIEPFLIEQLKLRKKQGSKYTIYSEVELQNVFTLFDLKNQGFITKDQCRKGNIFLWLFTYFLTAFTTLAPSEFHFTVTQDADIPEKVDLFNFMKLW